MRHTLDELAALQHRVGGDLDLGRSRHTNLVAIAARLMSRRPNQFTTAVMTMRITARAPRAATCRGVASWNCTAIVEASVEAVENSALREQGVEPDDHGDGDGLSERPRRGERDGAHDAHAGGRHHDAAEHLPLRRRPR